LQGGFEALAQFVGRRGERPGIGAARVASARPIMRETAAAKTVSRRISSFHFD
jgi:hypothetical protein